MENQRGKHLQNMGQGQAHRTLSGKFSHTMQIQHVFMRRTSPQLSPLQTKIHLYLSDKQIQRSLHKKDPPGPYAHSPQPVTGDSSAPQWGKKVVWSPGHRWDPSGTGRSKLEDAELCQRPGSRALTPSSAGRAPVPCLNVPINSQAQKIHEGLASLLLMSSTGRLRHLTCRMGCPVTPLLLPPPCTLSGCVTACSSSLPLLVPQTLL